MHIHIIGRLETVAFVVARHLTRYATFHQVLLSLFLENTKQACHPIASALFLSPITN